MVRTVIDYCYYFDKELRKNRNCILTIEHATYEVYAPYGESFVIRIKNGDFGIYDYGDNKPIYFEFGSCSTNRGDILIIKYPLDTYIGVSKMEEFLKINEIDDYFDEVKYYIHTGDADDEDTDYSQLIAIYKLPNKIDMTIEELYDKMIEFSSITNF